MLLDALLLSATAPGTAGAAATVAPPGSLTLRPDLDPFIPWILTLGQSTSFAAQITSPSGHDTTRGWRCGGGNTAPSAQLKTWTPRVKRGETLSVTIAGSATAGDIEMLAVQVAWPSGTGAKFIGRSELDRRVVQVHTIQGSITPTTNGTWPAGTALASIQDTLRANTEYAVLGAETGNAQDILCAVITGPDSAWGRVVIPITEQKRELRQPTVIPELAAWHGAAFIHVINSGNKTQTNLGLVANENGTARNVTLYLGQLG